MRQQRHAQAALWAAMGTAGLLLVGCSDDPAEANDNGPGNDDGEQSPLEEYMGGTALSGGFGLEIAGGGPGGQEPTEEDRQNVRQAEELIAACMQDEGFEYVPRTMDDTGASELDEAYSLEESEFVQEYGYGISTLMASGDGDEENKDPNEEIRDGLSESAREAYDRALWGDMAGLAGATGNGDDDAGSGPPAPPEPEEMGCQGQASAEVYEGNGNAVASVDMTEFQNLFEDIQALQERIKNDPQMVDAAEQWAHCMADGGYPDFEHPDDAQESVYNRMSDLHAGPGDGSEDADEERTSVVIGAPGSDVDPEELRELQELEIGVATADYDCQQEHYEDVYNDVAYEMEQEFVDDHRTELERYRDNMSEAGVLG